MRPFIVIRSYEIADGVARQEIIRKYVMSFAFEAFMSCLFREIFIQLIVFVAAMMFIFVGLPLPVCFTAIPLVIVFIYISVYGTYITKAMELNSDPITTCWIAEAYEPYTISLSMTNKFTNYDIIHENQLNSDDREMHRMKRSIVGTVSIDDHRCLHDSSWLSHFAVRPDFNFEAAAEALILRALKHAIDLQMVNVEMTTTECQMQLREVLTKIGFDIKQIYHRRILGNSNFRIMKSQLGINLDNWSSSKRK